MYMLIVNHWNLTMKKKYLEVTIDNKVTWHQHIENIKNEINKGIRILKKACHLLQEDTQEDQPF